LREEYGNMTRGVLFLTMEFGRSIDCKFKKDAEVFILLERHTGVTYSDIL
jgi:hypothetical protein